MARRSPREREREREMEKEEGFRTKFEKGRSDESVL